MAPLALAQVTLCSVDTRSPALAARSLRRSMAGIRFGQALLFTDRDRFDEPLPGVEIIAIPRLRSAADYSRFVMRRLVEYVRTSHVLVTQWDGFVVDPSAWLDEFLDHDYIGAVWPDQPASRSVGNGGFSLRSRRFLAAGLDPRITEEHPEDVVLCREWRQHMQSEHRIRFAPPNVARRFAFENETPRGAVFGFHGPKNLPLFVGEADIAAMLDELPTEFFRGRDARRLARSMLRQGMAETVLDVQRRRVEAGRDDWPTRWLAWAATASLRLRPGAPERR